jgi:peroxiredoxin 2/4
MSIVGKKFPDLKVKAAHPDGTVSPINVYELALQQKKKVLLFWYPKDFSSVCPSELHAFQKNLGEFEKRNTLVIGASCDSAEVHFAWLNTPREKGGIQGIGYPILADTNRNLSEELGILNAELVEDEEENYWLEGDNVAYRATYLVDEEGTVIHEGISHMTLVRDVNEYLRILDNYIHLQKHGEICLAE